ncbi:MAG: PEGA domain-containing protein [Polyangiaceae bacterium]
MNHSTISSRRTLRPLNGLVARASRRTTAIVLATLVSASVLTAAPASADDVEQAKTLFNAGAQAFNVGKFSAAIQAFDAAYALAPRPAILFSLAQAQRRQYFVDRSPQTLRDAIENYKKYVAQVEKGGRRADAVQALGELEPLAEKVLGKNAPPIVATPKAPEAPQVMITSPTPGAMVAVDGAAATEQPFVGELKGGKHAVVVSAPGYFPEKREIVAPDKGAYALDIPLKEQPALITMEVPSGSQIVVDGRPQGVAPLPAPLELTAGRHLIAVLKNGKVGHAEEIEVVRGESRTMRVWLTPSTQRYAAVGVVTTGAAALLAGGVFTALSLHKESQAQKVLDQRSVENIPASRLEDYDRYRQQRNDYRTAAFVGYGAGAALMLGGAMMMLFDMPNASSAPVTIRTRETPAAPQPPPKLEPDMSAAPWIGPGIMGAGFSGHF